MRPLRPQRAAALALLLALVLGVGGVPARSAPESAGARVEPIQVQVPRERVALRFARFDGDERADLLIARSSSFELRAQRPDGSFEPRGTLDVGPELGGALFDVQDLDGDGQQELYLLHRTGVERFHFDPASGAFARGESLLADQRGLAYLQLAPLDFLRPDPEGGLELIFPIDGAQLTFRASAGGVFELADQRETPSASVRVRMGGGSLARSHRARLALPRPAPAESGPARGESLLRIGRGGLIRSQDGTGLTPGSWTRLSAAEDPLEPFRRRHGIELRSGETLQALLRDLDGDGAQDFTVVHRNRIWVYRGENDVIDFDGAPSQLLKVSDADRVLALLLPIDGDGRPDLVLFKYELPSFARIVAGLAIGLSTEIEVLAYRNDGEPVFARQPSERTIFTVRVPPLLQVAARLEEIVEDFRDAFTPIRSLATGDFDGDGAPDVARIASGEGALELYSGAGAATGAGELQTARAGDFLANADGHEIVREVLFSRRRSTLGIESALERLRDAISRVQAAVLGGVEPTHRLTIDPDLVRRVDRVEAQDLDGDGRDDVIVYRMPDREDEASELRRIPFRDQQQPLYIWRAPGPTSARAASRPH